MDLLFLYKTLCIIYATGRCLKVGRQLLAGMLPI